MTDVAQHCWPVDRLGECIEALARAGGLPLDAHTPAEAGPDLIAPGAFALGRFIESTADGLGIEAEPVDEVVPELARLYRRSGPSIVRLHGDRGLFLAIVGPKGRRGLRVVTPDGVQTLDVDVVVAAMTRALREAIAANTAAMFGTTANDELGDVQRTLREAVEAHRLADSTLRGVWLLRGRPTQSWWYGLRQLRVDRLAGLLLVAHGLGHCAWLGVWYLLGQAFFADRLDSATVLGAALLLLTSVLLSGVTTWTGGELAVRVGTRLKQRLLAQSLSSTPRGNRPGPGAGEVLSRVTEAQVIESAALDGGTATLISGLELSIALLLGVSVFSGVAAAVVFVVLAVGWVALARTYAKARRAWTTTRRAMTAQLVEGLVGHRTRLAYEQPDQWHKSEDPLCERYYACSKVLDNRHIRFTLVLPRMWLVSGIGLIGLDVALSSTIAFTIAIQIGVVLLVHRAILGLVAGFTQIAAARIAWTDAATQPPTGDAQPSPRTLPYRRGAPEKGQCFLAAIDLCVGYPGTAAVVQEANFAISSGDHIRVHGPSGAGKSSLARVVAGLQPPARGLVLADGLDQDSVGLDAWRDFVTLCPQFHDNHLFNASLAFNLLLARRWPPRPNEIELAQTLCHELGLGSLLERMPKGIMQAVGDLGWQLSQGERARIFVGRALIAQSELTIFDESFSALDPKTVQRCLEVIQQRARTLMVIAHR